MKVRCLMVIASSLLTVNLTIAEEVYRLTGNNAKVTFVGTKPNGKHDGGFNGVRGTITLKDNDVESAQIKVDIDMNSLFTDTAQLTNHLKSRDFFEVQKYPKSTFVSSKLEKQGDQVMVTGKLTMHGVSKDLTFPAKITVSKSRVALESSFDINRQDWKISYGPGRVNDMVKITLKVNATR